jgi:hypothetical protein
MAVNYHNLGVKYNSILTLENMGFKLQQYITTVLFHKIDTSCQCSKHIFSLTMDDKGSKSACSWPAYLV